MITQTMSSSLAMKTWRRRSEIVRKNRDFWPHITQHFLWWETKALVLFADAGMWPIDRKWHNLSHERTSVLCMSVRDVVIHNNDVTSLTTSEGLSDGPKSMSICATRHSTKIQDAIELN
jgi:hypothetical protein